MSHNLIDTSLDIIQCAIALRIVPTPGIIPTAIDEHGRRSARRSTDGS